MPHIRLLSGTNAGGSISPVVQSPSSPISSPSNPSNNTIPYSVPSGLESYIASWNKPTAKQLAILNNSLPNIHAFPSSWSSYSSSPYLSSSPASAYSSSPSSVFSTSYSSVTSALSTSAPVHSNTTTRPNNKAEINNNSTTEDWTTPPTVSAQHLAFHQLHTSFLNKYTLTDVEYGAGATGFVVAGLRKEDSRDVAVKFILKDRIPVSSWIRDRQAGTIPMEIYILKRLNHPNIVKYLDFYEDNKFFYFVMESHGTPWSTAKYGELIESETDETDKQQQNSDSSPPSAPVVARITSRRRASQDLFECLEKNPRMGEKQIKHIFRQVASAVHYLHSNNVCHRDIKDENVVVDADLNVKLIDFGNARYIPRSSNKQTWFDTFHGTIHYAAPEILMGEKYRGPEADVWSLGVLLYTMAFGRMPFMEAKDAIDGKYAVPDSETASASAAARGMGTGVGCGATAAVGGMIGCRQGGRRKKEAVPKQTIFSRSLECLDLLSKMLDTDWTTRITVEGIMKHPWMTDSKIPIPSPFAAGTEVSSVNLPIPNITVSSSS
ncbi:hypothetical protein HK102_000667 [Quaeritorhiza haematococci]|nr:hypothetical protein HK102_000667 [Quaeritorhiza haematococci]